MNEIKKVSRQEVLKIITSSKVQRYGSRRHRKVGGASLKNFSYLPITPSYARGEIGVDNVKVLMATENLIKFESFRAKGAIDVAHSHPDHHSVAYQKQGRVKMQIGKETFIIEAGDTYFHPMGIVHKHEALEDSVRIETKIFPKGGAIAAWNKLVGLPD